MFAVGKRLHVGLAFGGQTVCRKYDNRAVEQTVNRRGERLDPIMCDAKQLISAGRRIVPRAGRGDSDLSHGRFLNADRRHYHYRRRYRQKREEKGG